MNKPELCAGVSCTTCYQRLTCESSTAHNVELPQFAFPFMEETANWQTLSLPHRMKRNGGPIFKSALYFGLGKRFGFKCQGCGTLELDIEENGQTLELHHKDGNHDNNHISNVDLICTKCHSKEKRSL